MLSHSSDRDLLYLTLPARRPIVLDTLTPAFLALPRTPAVLPRTVHLLTVILDRRCDRGSIVIVCDRTSSAYYFILFALPFMPA